MGNVMNDEQLNRFKKEIYEPYAKAWDIIGRLRALDLDEQSTWDAYQKALDEYEKKYPKGLGEPVYRVLLDAGDCAMRIWKNEM